MIYSQFKALKDYSFKDQVQRAAISVMNNIAEGFERNSDKEFSRFLKIAKGSAGEVRSMIYMAEELNYIEKQTSKELIESYNKLSHKIGSFIKYLEK